MVVICETLPLVERSVRLYNQCSCSMLRVNRTGAVAADNSEDGYERLVIQSRDYSGKLLIYGQKSRRYLCFNRRWKLIGSKKLRGGLCYFTEEMTPGGYYRFRSAEDRSKYLGFASSGRQLRGRLPSNLHCLNWVKIDSEFSIEKHNEIVAGEPKVSPEALHRELAGRLASPQVKPARRHRHRKHRLLHG